MVLPLIGLMSLMNKRSAMALTAVDSDQTVCSGHLILDSRRQGSRRVRVCKKKGGSALPPLQKAEPISVEMTGFPPPLKVTSIPMLPFGKIKIASPS